MKYTSALVCILITGTGALGQDGNSQYLIRDVRVFDGQDVQEHRNVLIENGTIRWIQDRQAAAADAQVIDGAGRTLLPGLIDSHVHMPFDTEGAARQAIMLGITTQLEMSGSVLANVKRLQAEDRPGLADVRTAGIPATIPGGHPTQMGGPPFPMLSSAGEAQSFIDARISEGSDFIKIIHDDGTTWPWTNTRVPMLDNVTMRALVNAAHERGKLAVVHILSEQQARDAIAAGADGLAHLFYGEALTSEFIDLAKKQGVFVIPTLTALYTSCGNQPARRPWLNLGCRLRSQNPGTRP